MSIYITDEASILHIIINETFVLSQLSKGINNDTKDDVQEYNNDNQEESQIENNTHKEFFLGTVLIRDCG